MTDEEPEPADQTQSSKYKSQVSRCLLFRQDRADRIFIVNALCPRMSNTTHQSFAKLTRHVRYLRGERQWRRIVSYRKSVTRRRHIPTWTGPARLGTLSSKLQKKNSSKNTFIQKHFHPKQKTISSTTLSSKNGFIQ